MDVPAEIARREDRLNAIAQAKAKIEERAGPLVVSCGSQQSHRPAAVLNG
jgi:hypothetical protein